MLVLLAINADTQAPAQPDSHFNSHPLGEASVHFNKRRLWQGDKKQVGRLLKSNKISDRGSAIKMASAVLMAKIRIHSEQRERAATLFPRLKGMRSVRLWGFLLA
jgi:hypothetical protein